MNLPNDAVFPIEPEQFPTELVPQKMSIETLRARRGGTQSGTFTTFYIAHKNTHMVELSPLSPSFVARLTGVD